MSRLTNIVNPAELRRGCIFAEDFRSNEDVALNGGVKTGDVQINNGGCFCSTGTNYIQYDISEWGATLTEFSFVAKGVSQNNDTNFKRLFTNDGTDLEFYARDGETTCTFRINGTAYTSEAGLLGVDETVDIGVSYDGANIRFYRNGVQHGADQAYSTDITLNTNGVFFISDDSSSTGFSGGSIKNFKCFNKGLSAGEMLDYANNSTYNYRNKVIVDLPMGMAQHDSSNTTSTILTTNAGCAGQTDWTDTNGDGVADDWAISDGGGFDGASIVTGNGFVGNAQRVERATGGSAGIGCSGTLLTAGKRYKLSLKYRTNASIVSASGLYSYGTIPTNTGNAAFYETEFAAAGGGVYLSFFINGTSSYLEIDEVCLEELAERTLDVSGKGNNATLGDGSTPTTYPTKLTKHGYDFDGGDYLESNIDLDLGTSTGSLSFVMEFSPDFNYDLDDVVYLYGTDSSSIFAVIKQNNAASNVLDVWMGSEKIASVAEATYSPYWRNGMRNTLIVSGTGGDGSANTTDVWLNEGKIIDGGLKEWYTNVTTYTLTLGASYSHGNFYDGKIHSFGVYPLRITPLQAKDLHINLMQQINDI